VTIYTQVSIRKLKEIHTATHPGGAREERLSALALRKTRLRPPKC